MTNSLLYSFLAHGPTTWWPRTRVPSRQNQQTIVRARSYSPELLICSRYLCHATTKTENSLFICMSTFPRSKTRRSIDWGQSKLKKGGDDRSVIRLYAEISLFSHSTTISLSPFVATPRERSRAFPSISEPLEAFLRFPSQYSRAQLIEARLTLHCVTTGLAT